ncbi:MAG: hemerythrin family protein [Magnetospirillum sp.]|nr:hemerythrin family protein [Magnetospirillum sp.]
MTQIAWGESFGVGNALLDSDHRILFDLLAQLHDATDTGQSHDVVGSVISALAEYTEHHFRREEALLAAAAFPELEAHKGLHRELEARVHDISRRYHAGERAALNESMMELLKKWLTEHIQVTDKSYRPWVERVDVDGSTPSSQALRGGKQS